MRTGLFALIAAGALLGGAQTAEAHFQTLIPSHDILTAETGKKLEFEMTFTHPMADGPAMDMGQPLAFGALLDGEQRLDFMETLEPGKVDGKAAYSADVLVRRPGGYVFFLEPAPYYEASEEIFIKQYTKVVVDAFDAGTGWDAEVGFPVEIEPLTRPYGLWTNNLFQGIVKQDGKPVPYAELEVEYHNEDGVEAPNGAYETQVIKADGNGVFTYAMPRAGWWGFCAMLSSGTELPKPDGSGTAPMDSNAVLWVKTRDMK